MKWLRKKRDPREAIVQPVVKIESDPLGRNPSSASLHLGEEFFGEFDRAESLSVIDKALFEQAKRENELIEQGWLLMLTQEEALGDERMGLLVETRLVDSGDIDNYTIMFETSIGLSPEVPFGQVDRRTITDGITRED